MAAHEAQAHASAGYVQTLNRSSRRESASRIVPLLVELIEPKSVVDVGCGTGTWLAAFEDAGISDVLGIDTAGVGDSLEIPKTKFVIQDVSRPLAVSRTFDLALCLEVAEHLPPSSAGTLIASLTQLAPVIVFSAAIPFQGGNHHVNEQWPDYWWKLFVEHDFVAIDCLRPRVWRYELDAWWYAQNMMLYVREDLTGRDSFSAESSFFSSGRPNRIVHPELLLKWVHDAENPSTQRIIARMIRSLARRMNRRQASLSRSTNRSA